MSTESSIETPILFIWRYCCTFLIKSYTKLMQSLQAMWNQPCLDRILYVYLRNVNFAAYISFKITFVSYFSIFCTHPCSVTTKHLILITTKGCDKCSKSHQLTSDIPCSISGAWKEVQCHISLSFQYEISHAAGTVFKG